MKELRKLFKDINHSNYILVKEVIIKDKIYLNAEQIDIR